MRLILIAFIWAVLSHRAEARQFLSALVKGQWHWVWAATMLQIVYYLVFAKVYQYAFRIVGIQRRISELLPVLLGSLFVNVIAPTGGAAGTALFVDDAVQRGWSAARAATGALLAVAADLGVFLIILPIGVLYLFRTHDLRSYEIVASLLFLTLVCSLAAVFFIGWWRPSYVRWILEGCHRIVDRTSGFLHLRSPLRHDQACNHAEEFVSATSAVRSHPSLLAQMLTTAIVAHGIDILCVYLLFLAFNQPAKAAVLIAGYAMA